MNTPPLQSVRRFSLSSGLCALLVTGCFPSQDVSGPPPPARRVTATKTAPETSAPPSASVLLPPTEQPPDTPRLTRTAASSVTMEGVAFDSRSHRLRLVDQPCGPGTWFADAAAAGTATGALAAANGGFFTPEGEPLGLAIAAGRRSGGWNPASSLGSGVWFEDASGHSAIRRREHLDRHAAEKQPELLQAGPMLIDQGRAVTGLDATKTSARTVLMWDGGHRWWLGRSSPCTLAQIATLLAGHPPAGWRPRLALNLDGGRSADLWVSQEVPGGPFHSRPVWNRPVRNFLVLQVR